jgi:hypothetical protein
MFILSEKISRPRFRHQKNSSSRFHAADVKTPQNPNTITIFTANSRLVSRFHAIGTKMETNFYHGFGPELAPTIPNEFYCDLLCSFVAKFSFLRVLRAKSKKFLFSFHVS